MVWQTRSNFNAKYNIITVLPVTVVHVDSPNTPPDVEFTSVILVTGIACGVTVIVVIVVMIGIIYIKKYR